MPANAVRDTEKASAEKPGRKRRASHRGRYRKPQSDRRASAPRRCLRCQDKFDSSWEGNRLCPRCRDQLNKSGAGLEEQPLSLPVLP